MGSIALSARLVDIHWLILSHILASGGKLFDQDDVIDYV